VPATLWHEDVQAYAVSDAKTGKALASLYVDLYPRDGKYKHAAVFSFRNGSTRLNRAPQVAFIVNMDRKGLTLDEMDTLLHELGHALHKNLSATRYLALAGTSVLPDFVDAPSQMLEDWVYDKCVLECDADEERAGGVIPMQVSKWAALGWRCALPHAAPLFRRRRSMPDV
jgi:thimet oligopeptidase